MRVGLDYRPATGFPNSGIGRQNIALEEAFRARPDVQLQLFSIGPLGHAIRKVAHCPGRAAPLDGIHRLPERLRFEAGFLPQALRDAEVEVYMANLNMGLPIGRKPAGMRYILQLHDVFQLTLSNAHGSKLKARIYGQTDRLSIGHSVRVADRIWTPSQFTADETVRLFPHARDKVRVLPNLVEGFTAEPAELDTPLPARYWLCVGTREPRKNIPWFVEAWQIARRQFPKTPDLVLVGGPDGLSSAQRELPGLHIVSGISDGQLHQVYRQADRLWHPSYGEGFGLPVVEALGVGTPVAVASGSSLDEVTPDGSPRFSPDDQGALVRLMGMLSTEEKPDPAPLLAWAHQYGVEAYRRRFNELLDELSGGARLMPLAMPVGVLIALLFGVLVWVLPAIKVTAALIGVAAVVTIIRRPLRGLLLFGVLATFLPYATVQIGIRTTVSEALVMLIWASLLAHRVFALYNPPLHLLRTERWLIALMMFSALPFVVGQLTVNADGNGPVNWVRWLFNLSPLFLVPRLLNDEKSREQMTVALLLGTLFLLLLSIPVYLKSGSSTAIISIIGGLGYSNLDTLNEGLSGLSTRMGTPWTHPNIAGGALAMLLPLAFCIGVTRQGPVRTLGLAVAVLAAAGLLFTGSRGALLSLILVMCWMARRRVPYVGRLLMAGVFLGALLLMFYPPLQERLIGLFSSDDASTAIRFQEYSHFPDAMKMFPLGIGFKVDPPVPGTGLWGISNLWLNYVYKLGVPGMLLFIAVTVSWWKETRLDAVGGTLNRDTALWFGTRAGVLAALLSGIFDHYFSFTTVLIALFWLLLGLNLHEARRLQKKPHRTATESGETT